MKLLILLNLIPTAGAGLLAQAGGGNGVPAAWLIGFPVTVLVIQIVQTVVMFVLAQRANRVNTLEADLKASLARGIEDRIALAVAELNLAISKCNMEVASSKERTAERFEGIAEALSAGSRRFHAVEGEVRQMEVSITKQIAALVERVATKDEFSRLDEKIDELRDQARRN